jgi:Flp pilus assembly protein TadD
MRSATSFAALAFLVVGVCLASPMTTALARWTGQATAHFALLTASSQGEGGRELLERLERTRLFFEKMGWPSHDLQRPLQILAFNSEKDFDTYRPISAAFAFYQRTHDGDFVLMRSLEPEHYSIVVHEYTHFIVEHSGLRLPIWLNEGLADFYSTMESRDAQTIVGAPPPGREATLRHSEWMDWPDLVAVDQHSPYYRELDKMRLFYAQSWAMAHVLALDEAYKSKFRSFLTNISTGSAAAADPWTATYNQTLQYVGAQTQQSFKENKLQSEVLDLDIRPGVLQSAEVADPAKQCEFALAAVLAANPNTQEEAKARFEALAARYPEDARPAASLGILLATAGKQTGAEQAFEVAVKDGSQDPEILFRLAHLKLTHNDADGAVELLKRAVAIDPNYYNGLLQLGFAAAKGGQFELAAQTLARITAPKPEHAFQVSYTLAYCLSELNQAQKARAAAEQARKLANSAQDKQQATELLAYIRQEADDEDATK